MVPIKEMTDILRVSKTQIGLRPKQWVRLKRGNLLFRFKGETFNSNFLYFYFV